MDKVLMRQRARDLRKTSTDAERYLWYHLRAHRLGYKFKRQVPIDEFIVDFICYEKYLVIELDGGQHQEKQTYDMQRTLALNKKGFHVLRFWNQEVLQHIEVVLEVIYRSLSPAPLPQAGEGIKEQYYLTAGATSSPPLTGATSSPPLTGAPGAPPPSTSK